MRDVMNTKTRPGASDETAARLGAGRQPLVRASRLGGRRRVGSSQSARHQHRPHDRRHDARRHAAPGRLQDAGRRGGSSGSERCKRPRHLGTERGRRSKAKLTLTSCLEGGCGCDSCARSANTASLEEQLAQELQLEAAVAAWVAVASRPATKSS